MKRNFRKKTAAFLTSAVIMLSVSTPLSVSAETSAVWVKSDKGYSCRDESGEYLKGWQTINGKTYYFDKEGFAVTGWKRLYKNNDPLTYRTYYFLTSDKGSMAKGWVKIGGETYYFSQRDGVVCTGPTKINGTMYGFGNDGRLLRNCGIRLREMTYIIDENGVVTNQAEIEDVLIPLDQPMENLEWGMTEKEIAEALGIDTYVISGSQMALPKAYDTAEQVTYYIGDNGLQSYSISRGKNEGNPPGHYSANARGRININHWHKGKLSGNIKNMSVYRKGDSLLVFMNDDTSVVTLVISENVAKGYFDYEKDLAETLAEAMCGGGGAAANRSKVSCEHHRQ